MASISSKRRAGWPPRTVHTTIANYQLRPRYRYAPALVNYDKLTPSVQAVPMDEGFSIIAGSSRR